MTALRAGLVLGALSLAGCDNLLGLHDITSDGKPVTLRVSSAVRGVAQQPLGPITVEVVDVEGRAVSGFSGEVVLTLGNNPGGATLLGTQVATAAQGTARFDPIGIDRPGAGYTLVASIAELPAVTSSAIEIVPPRFTPVPTGIPGGPITSIAVSPAPAGATATVFAGAGDGVYKSTDGGASWKRASFGAAAAATRLLADPAHPGVVYLLASSGSSSLRKTVDGGATWHELDGAGLSSYISSVALDPNNPSVIYTTGTRLRRSSDGGVSWDELGSLPACSQIAIDPVKINTLYCANNGTNGVALGVYKSSDAGAAWKPANNGLTVGYISTLAATPRGLFVVIDNMVYRSTDAAGSWTSVLSTTDRAIAYAPSRPDRVYLADSDRIAVSNDGGASFAPSVNAGDFLQGLAVDPTNPDVVYGAGSRGVVVSTNGGVSWSPSSSGLDAHAITSLATAPGATLMTLNGSVLRSINDGASWSVSSPSFATVHVDRGVTGRVYLCGLSYLAISNDGGANFTGGFVNGLVSCDRILTTSTKWFAVGLGRLLTSTDGANWSDTGLGTDAGFYVSDIALGDPSGDVLVAATSDGVYRSTNGGMSFTRLFTGYVTELIADRSVPPHVIASQCPGFQVSSDGGATFRAASAAGCTNTLTSAGSTLYAAGTSYTGPSRTVLLKSTDGGAIWVVSDDAGIPAGVFVSSIAVSDDGATIYLGTSAGLYKGSSH